MIININIIIIIIVVIIIIIDIIIIINIIFNSYILDNWFYLISMMILPITDFILSFWQLEIFTARHNRIPAFARAFLPYLLQKIALLAVELILLFAVTKGDIALKSRGFSYEVAFAAAAASLVLSTLVTFVTGAARTMMYHDEKR